MAFRSMLPRPISICDMEDNKLTFLYAVVGKGTKIMSEKKVGDNIEILGPLGNGFPIDEFKGKKVALVAGGIGIAPMLYLAKKLEADVDLYAGFRDEIYFTEEFKDFTKNTYIATNTGSQAQVAILQNKVQLSSTTYLDGKEHGGINEMIAPGLFLVIFFMLITFFGNQMLTSSTEEKENRTVEMLLTMVKTDTLITGKILSLMVLALIQMLVIILPVAAGYLAFGSKLQLPNMDLSLLVFDPVRIGLALVIFLASFMMFTGMLVTLGAMMPTAKEANQWFGLVIMLIFGPFYGITAFVSFPDSPFVKFLSLFPFTAPIPLLLRNAVGNLPAWEGLLGVALLIVAAVLVLWLAVRKIGRAHV